jgi:phage terminase small subunit
MNSVSYLPKRVVMTVPDTDDGSAGNPREASVRQITFAETWARTGNKSVAYIEAYQPDPMTAPGTIYSAASRISNLPAVQQRYQEIMQQRALELVVDIREALQWQFDIATADPNDVIYTIKRACRNCYGLGHKFQWKDEEEYIQACVDAIDGKKLPPTDDGGYGYTKALEPVVSCPECLGQGQLDVVTNDTTKLQGKARKLFKGVEYKNGAWVVQLHDQQKAWEMVCRMLGGFDDRLTLEMNQRRKGNVYPNDVVNETDAAKAYNSLIG